MPDAWEAALERWRELAAPHLTAREEGDAPDRNDQYLVLQSLLGAWPVELLDEPSDGVQPSIVQEIGDFLAALVRRRPIGVLLVEQNIDLVQTVAHRAYVMDKGRVVVTITRDELLDTERVAEFLAV